MQARRSSTMPLIHSVWSENGLRRDVLVVLAGSALLTGAAWVRVPMWPVPMTMQTFAVLLIGATCGPRLGVAAGGASFAGGGPGPSGVARGKPVVVRGAPLRSLG